MHRFYATIIAIVIMAALIPISPQMATSPSAPLATHFIYMLAHANILHWLINAWALLVLHNLFRLHRLVIAYALAIAISFIPHLSLQISNLNPQPSTLLGSSVIAVFFMGFVAPYLWRKDRMATVLTAAIILIGFFIPGIAAFHHLLMFIAGLIAYKIEFFLYPLLRH